MIPEQYTITGAADWPILIVLAGVIMSMMGIMLAMVAFMWRDLRSTMQDIKLDSKDEIKVIKEDTLRITGALRDELHAVNKQHNFDIDKKIQTNWDMLREKMSDCKDLCCPEK